MAIDKILFVVIDGFGVGEGIDYDKFDSKGANTLGHVIDLFPDLALPTFEKLGILGLASDHEQYGSPQAAVARLLEKSAGNDTPTGHWELSGAVSDNAPPIFENGFPEHLLLKIRDAWKVEGILGNVAMNGQKVIDKYGAEQLKNGWPIVYTSTDSVFQVAANTDIIPLETLYRWCEIAREILVSPYHITRVIARPFSGKETFIRLPDRKDWSLAAPSATMLDVLQENSIPTIGVGKIGDVFAHRGLSKELHPKGDEACFKEALGEFKAMEKGLVFVNLVESDTYCGHMRDPQNYAKILTNIDKWLGEVELEENEAMLLSSDHGNDPTFKGNNHTRELVPFAFWGPRIFGDDLGFLPMAGVGSTVCELLGIQNHNLPCKSFLDNLVIR